MEVARVQLPLYLVIFWVSLAILMTTLRAGREGTIDLRPAFVCAIIEMFRQRRPRSRMSHERTGATDELRAQTEPHCPRSSAASVRPFCPPLTLRKQRRPCFPDGAVSPLRFDGIHVCASQVIHVTSSWTPRCDKHAALLHARRLAQNQAYAHQMHGGASGG